MTTATAQAAANIAFMKYWGMVPENVAVNKLLQIYGIQKQVSKLCSRHEQKAIHFSIDISP
jgi:mevalonate pyrophosphate decarboxylase